MVLDFPSQLFLEEGPDIGEGGGLDVVAQLFQLFDELGGQDIGTR